MFKSDGLNSLFVLGNPNIGEWERENELNVLPRTPTPSTGILDEPEEPDGAERGWGVQGVCGEVLAIAPGSLSDKMRVCVLFVHMNVCVFVCTKFCFCKHSLLPSFNQVVKGQQIVWYERKKGRRELMA